MKARLIRTDDSFDFTQVFKTPRSSYRLTRVKSLVKKIVPFYGDIFWEVLCVLASFGLFIYTFLTNEHTYTLKGFMKKLWSTLRYQILALVMCGLLYRTGV